MQEENLSILRSLKQNIEELVPRLKPHKLPLVSLLTLLVSRICRLKFKHEVK